MSHNQAIHNSRQISLAASCESSADSREPEPRAESWRGRCVCKPEPARLVSASLALRLALRERTRVIALSCIISSLWLAKGGKCCQVSKPSLVSARLVSSADANFAAICARFAAGARPDQRPATHEPLSRFNSHRFGRSFECYRCRQCAEATFGLIKFRAVFASRRSGCWRDATGWRGKTRAVH